MAWGILLISLDGNPLGADGCRYAVKEHCDKLGIKTHAGKPVVPHRLRHSFGTLNIENIGLELSITEIMEQYRHANIQTTYDLYIAKNPLKKQRGYERTMSRIRARNSGQPFIVSSSNIQPFSRDSFMTENQALLQVKALKLNYRSFREYALSVGKARKNGNDFLYSSPFVTDIATNYFTRTEAMDMLKLKRATFFDWTKKDCISFIQIGRVSLFRREVILEKRRSA